VVSATDEVAPSVFESGVAPPSLQKIDWLIQIELVLENLSRKLRVVEDLNERVPELGFELLDGFLIERRIILLDIKIRIGSSGSMTDSTSPSSSSSLSPPRPSAAAAAAAAMVDSVRNKPIGDRCSSRLIQSACV
jgi:hypothetical protein